MNTVRKYNFGNFLWRKRPTEAKECRSMKNSDAAWARQGWELSQSQVLQELGGPLKSLFFSEIRGKTLKGL